MPRRRHDSDSEDSDGSDLDSPEPRRQKSNKSTRRSGRADSDSSEERVRSKSSKSKRKEPLSESDTSPVKKSISSKVAKSKDKERNKKGSKGSKRQLNTTDSSPDKKRARGRQSSPSFHGGQQPVGKTFKRGNKNDRESNQRVSMRFQRSPDRNPRRRPEDQTLGQFLDSPPRRGKGSGEFEPRGFDEGDRGYGNRNEPRQRSFDRPIDRRTFSGSERESLRSRSPQDRWNRGRKDSWRDEDLQMDGRLRRSSSPNMRRGRNRSLSPMRRNPNRSLSPMRRNPGILSPAGTRRQFPNRERSASVENNKSLGQKRGKKSGRKKGTNSEMLASDSDLQSPNEPSMPNKNKGSKKKRDDSVERSFARSKMSLSEENLHSGNLDDIDRSFESLKKSKKTKGKRRKSTSDSESVSPDRSKKLDKTSKSGAKVREKISKKGKKSKTAKNDLDKERRSLSKSAERTTGEGSRTSRNKKKQSNSVRQNSVSKSPSPHNDSMRSEPNRSRSSELNRSTEGIIGRNHDMAKFESEPESGEITDSEEEGDKAGRQAVKSQIKKPSEEELEKLEDEKYWEEKRKASLKADDQSLKGEERRNKDRGNKRRQEEIKEPQPTIEPSSPAPKKPKTQDGGVAALTGRTGGAYIPPARLRAMQAKITDKSSVEYQRISWEALKKSINGLVNKVNVSNIEMIVRELFQENIVRGRGLMSRSIIQAQAASPTFTHVYAALVAIVNTKFPQNGELVLKRLVQQFRRGYKRNDKNICLSSTRFIAHLVNQQVAHEVLSLEILTLLLEEPTDDSVEVSIGFLKECGQKLTDVSPRGINAIFERLRNILHEGQIEQRVQYMVEVMFAVRKDGFKDNKAVLEDLDLVEEDDQFTHLMTLDDVTDGEELLNVFRPDPNFLESEEKYKVLKREILGEGSSDEEEDGSGSGSSSSEDDSGNEEDAENKQTIVDTTETNMVALRRTVYLTIQSSMGFEESAHKLMKMDLKPGQEVELCNMILDCCGQMRTYEKFFGLLAGRFCMIDKKYVEPFQQMFMEQYGTIHRLETNKLRNVAKFFAHLLHTDSLSWAVLSCIKLNEDDTTSASRIFIKILFQELSEFLGLSKLNERLKDPTLQEYFTGLMPRDNPRDTRFAINFFTTIGLGGLTDDLRDHLKSVSKKLMEQKQEQAAAQEESDSNSSDSMSSDSSDSSSDEDSSNPATSDSESSEDDRRKKKKKGNAEKKKEAEKTKKKVKGKARSEPQISKSKRDRRDKDKSNGAIEKSDKRKDKKSKRSSGKQVVEDPKQRDEQFRRLAKLANYGNDVLPMETDRRDRQKGSQDLDDQTDRRGNRGIRSPERDNFEGEGRRRELVRDMYDPRDRLPDPRDRGGYDRRLPVDRGYEGFGGRDDREPRRGRKGRDFIDDERDNRPIQIERNFARMDVYESKFEREREMNLEYLRNHGEFEDYFRGRNDLGRDAFDRGDYRGPRGRADEFDERRMGPPYGERELGRGMDEGRRRNRSEERAPIIRDERRRRR